MNRHSQKSTNTFSEMKADYLATLNPNAPSNYGADLYNTQYNDSGQYYAHHGGQYYAGLPRNSKKSPLHNEYVKESHCCCACYHDLPGISRLHRANQGDEYLQNPRSHMSFIIPPESSEPNYAELDDCKRYALMVAFWFAVLAFGGIFKYFEVSDCNIKCPKVEIHAHFQIFFCVQF
ncbi:hypothetical protein PoB_006977300 [Plakobranchus ocellatus]|uniref:Uncharacterized protein n=1 Tax=Plakobranchus ocellatus TaxID=259542 RepID=A0AAV4DGT4_9GAST|nr:hypothetical protein PoB_006977300 [Plakobranchus ocellatus]